MKSLAALELATTYARGLMSLALCAEMAVLLAGFSEVAGEHTQGNTTGVCTSKASRVQLLPMASAILRSISVKTGARAASGRAWSPSSPTTPTTLTSTSLRCLLRCKDLQQSFACHGGNDISGALKLMQACEEWLVSQAKRTIAHVPRQVPLHVVRRRLAA